MHEREYYLNMLDKELLNRNKNINRGFRNLEIWQQAIELYAEVRKKIKTHIDIPFKTKAQIEDSIHSVSSNIAEGYCRRSLKENIHFINIALASLGENYSQLFALVTSGDLEKEWFKEYDNLHYSLENKIIGFNKKLLTKLKNNEEWRDDYIIRDEIERYEEI
jgi:four helix bundle protein